LLIRRLVWKRAVKIRVQYWRMEAKMLDALVDEGRKRVIGIMAAILAARQLCQLESTRPSPALHSIIEDTVIFAERIMKRIDAEWPTR